MLNSFGCECTVANDGVEALEIFINNIFDLVFMDVAMPRMDGNECTIKIRQLESLRGSEPITIIGLSGNARKEHKDKGLAAGMSRYIIKPIQKNEIMNIVKSVGAKH
ncbi:hypothetical protein AKO1_009297 [Acrasis kona]|uniref:Response regulatory domain-containing protein n=1 Tax=Acrasis kona TaxID=1008807 RepID=A0AAW2ZKE2_9EUKA